MTGALLPTQGLARMPRRLFGLFLATAVLTGCATPESRYKVLSFFFDGVPRPGAPAAQAPETPTPDKARAARDRGPRRRTSEHKPYTERNCTACHGEDLVRKSKGGFATFDLASRKDPWSACTTCHSKPETVGQKAAVSAPGAWLHGPVVVGLCKSCHLPHRSRFNHLLRTERAATSCLHCHKEFGEREGPMAPMDCTACHDPHRGGASKDLYLRGGLARSCIRCHALRPKERKWLHGPVATGNCIACHDAHGGKGAADHVRRPLAAVCVKCHDRTRLPEDRGCLPARTCDACHTPHAARAQAEFFLKARIGKEALAEALFSKPPADSMRPSGAFPPPQPAPARK